ncbi:MAG: sodium-dependent transporter [Gammaproteobacteria bacterium]|nr:sodium-dependent transporter [Gammaproteobacteria bacterium]
MSLRSPVALPPGPAAVQGWRTRTTFVLALSASAVGLGNLWRFSYLSGEYGGAPFVITYLACLFLIAVPVMVAEVVVGAHGRAGPLVAIREASDRSLISRGWMFVGALACVTGLLILVLYMVVAAWGLAYAQFMYTGVFSAAPAREVGEHFGKLLLDPVRQGYWLSVFALAVCGIVMMGVRRGLGLAVWLAVPALLALLGYLIRFGFENGDLRAAGDFLFNTRWIDFNAEAALVAMAHAFYTLGIGVATGVCYGAYTPERIPIGRSVMAVAVFDGMIALLVGLAIFPIVFANNVEPTYGPGLLFVSIPYAFGNTSEGELYGTLFFIMVVLAALGSAVAILEPIVAALKEHTPLGRFTSTVVVGWTAWLMGMAVITSLASREAPQWYGNRNLFEFLDYLGADVLLPLVCLLFALFVGWRLRPEILRAQLYRESNAFYVVWRFLLRYIVPAAIIVLMLASVVMGPGVQTS